MNSMRSVVECAKHVAWEHNVEAAPAHKAGTIDTTLSFVNIVTGHPLTTNNNLRLSQLRHSPPLHPRQTARNLPVIRLTLPFICKALTVLFRSCYSLHRAVGGGVAPSFKCRFAERPNKSALEIHWQDVRVSCRQRPRSVCVFY
jgi:hypothetical protein